jgi:hypothetical protein
MPVRVANNVFGVVIAVPGLTDAADIDDITPIGVEVANSLGEFVAADLPVDGFDDFGVMRVAGEKQVFVKGGKGLFELFGRRLELVDDGRIGRKSVDEPVPIMNAAIGEMLNKVDESSDSMATVLRKDSRATGLNQSSSEGSVTASSWLPSTDGIFKAASRWMTASGSGP